MRRLKALSPRCHKRDRRATIQALLSKAGASRTKRNNARSGKRKIGFGCFLISNGLWVVWGWHDRAYALVVLQIALAILNIRGDYKNEPGSSVKSEAWPAAQ